MWSDSDIFALIDAWHSLEQLYNVKNPKYHFNDEKSKNLNKLQGKLEEMGVTVTVPQITKKMLSLKNHYAAEKRKTEASMKTSGASRDDVYVTKWQFYQSLSFLHDNFVPRDTESNLKRTSLFNAEQLSTQPRSSKKSFPSTSTSTPIDRVADSMENMVRS